MDIANLPPMPDVDTGEPRPPRAPLEADVTKPGHRREAAYRKAPQPPAGEGPLLEWFYPDRSTRLVSGLTLSLIVLATYILKDGGFSWVTNPWLWLIAAPWPFLFLVTGKNIRMSAGADWLAYSKGFVKTYELVEVNVTIGGAAHFLDITDRRGVRISAQLNDLQKNYELWDLVYNGILHSVHVGKAETNRRAREHLKLDFPPHLAAGGSVAG